MPHADFKFSADMQLDLPDLFAFVEDALNDHDPEAGACKCRAYPAAHFHHTHLLVEVSCLAKPSRDAAWTAAVMQTLETGLKSRLTQPCQFSLKLIYSPSTYVTGPFVPSIE
ncbi:MAG: hypothetical protein AAF393_08560 [Pseudomonadota bacterium]